MKTPDQVGRDFDAYVEQWDSSDHVLGPEPGFPGATVELDGLLARPGDEWGDISQLEDLYRPLFSRLLPGAGDLSILEIGAGGGRSTQAVVSTVGSRIAGYHVIDVSATFVDVLRDRLPDQQLAIHIVADVDLSGLPTNHFDLCLAQSSWSHISLYDQYRYLRDLRRVMKHDAPVVVNGQLLLGVGDDWTWSRFRRRVYQHENKIEGVFHEVTGIGVLVEMLVRLEYRIEVVHRRGFVARSGQRNPDAFRQNVSDRLLYPYLPSLQDFAHGAWAERRRI